MAFSCHRFAFSLLAAGACTLLARPSHAAPTVLTQCQVINQSGSYVLGADITVPNADICFSIRAADVSFDGAGKTITVQSSEALEVAHFSGTAPAHVSVKNFKSNGGVRIYGNDISDVTFDGLEVDGINNMGGDEVVIQNNKVGQYGIAVSNGDQTDWAPLKNKVLNNQITGGATDVKILLEVIGGKVHPCPRTDTLLENNTILNTRNDPPPEATASVRIRCATHSIFRKNQIRGTGTTIGLYLRDESDDGTYEDNVFWVNTQEAIRIASGNVDKTFPSRNVFKNNVFRSDQGPATFLQGIGSENHFQNNCFLSKESGLINQNAGNVYDHNTFYVTGTDSRVHTLDYEDPVKDVWTRNIFSHSGKDTLGFGGLFTFARYSGDENLFHNRAGAVAFGNMATSLADWKQKSLADGNASEQSSIEADPLLIDPENGNLCLSENSPARGAAKDGTDLGAKPYGCTGGGATGGAAGAGGAAGSGAAGGGGAGGSGGATAGSGGASAGGAKASGDSSDDGGCGCRTAPSSRSTWLSIAGVLGLAWSSIRRRLTRDR
ncbi:MAG: right-handed parallel beta-helix repeat-containing protein [Polyangiaceae bacterium]